MNRFAFVSLAISLSLPFTGCNWLTQKAQENQEESKQKSEQAAATAQELSKYGDCVIEANTEDATKKCEAMKAGFSENTQRIMRESKKEGGK